VKIPPQALEKRRQLSTRKLNFLRKLQQRWDNRLTFDNLRLGERYFKEGLHIYVCFKVSRNPQKFVAHLHRTPSKLKYPPALKTFVEILTSDNRNNQKSVLVDIVKMVEAPKRVIPTFVWFDRVDSFFSRLPHGTYFSSLAELVSLGVTEDRKAYLPPRRVPLSPNNKRICEIVQDPPKVVDGVAQDRRKLQWNIPHARHIKNQIARLRLTLTSNNIRLGIAPQKGTDFELQVTDVLFGPFDFYTDTREIFGR
jgi:hypothetical protein